MTNNFFLVWEAEFRAAIQEAIQDAVQDVVARFLARGEQMLEKARREREAGLQDVARLRTELAAEVAAMEKVQAEQRTRVEVDVGGVRFVTSTSTLRSRPGSMLDAKFSGRYLDEKEEDGSYFEDRDGSMFGHVLAFLRDNVVAAGCEDDVHVLQRLKRELDYYCLLEPAEEKEVGLVVGEICGRLLLQFNSLQNAWTGCAPTHAWTACAPMHKSRRYFGMCVLAGEVYITGGVSAQRYCLDTVERYSPSSDTWSPVAAMPFARWGHCACAVGNAMYVFGDNNRLFLKYEREFDSWSEVAIPPSSHYVDGLCACAVGTDIFVIGTKPDFFTGMTEVRKYSTNTNVWSRVSPIAECRRKGPTACVLKGLIYVAGHWKKRNFFWRYNPTADTWCLLAPMDLSYYEGRFAVLFAVGNNVYAGSGGKVQEYDPELDRWSTTHLGNPYQQWYGACAVTVQVDIFDAMIKRIERKRERERKRVEDNV